MIVEFPAPANCAPRSYAPGLMQQARRAFYESSDARGTAVERPAVVGPRCLDPNNPRHRPQNTDTLESWFKVGWRVETVGGFAQKRDVSGYLEDWRGNRARVGRSGLRGADYPRAAQRRGAA